MQSFFRALSSAGHAVRRIVLGGTVTPQDRSALGGWASTHCLEEEASGWTSHAQDLATEAEVVVSAGPYGPPMLAAAVCSDRPWFADVPGDPFAELHALEVVGDVPASRRAAALRVALGTVSRADAFSVVSVPQHHALLGQLALLGRLPVPWHDPVACVPIGADPQSWTTAPSDAPAPPLRVALSGALNAWLDLPLLQSALEQAWQRGMPVELHVTGGPDPGQPPAWWANLQAWANAHTGAHLHGWLPEADLDKLLRRCHLGIVLDQPSLEPVLGCRTRVLRYVQAGLTPVMTLATPLSHELSARAAGYFLAPGDRDGLVQALAAALAPLSGATDRAARCKAAQEWLAVRSHPDPRHLLAFVDTPWRLAPGTPSHTQALAAEGARLRQELDGLRAAPSIRALNQIHRMLRWIDPRSKIT